jgi:putative phage-type endonuclease
MEQRSDEWFAVRLGRVTASRMADIIAKTKSGYSTSRANYMSELICERLTGKRTAFFQTAAMAWGTNTEPMAALAYEAKTGNLVEGVGFVPHPTIDMAGASPDGLVDHDGLIEIKCPNTSTHLDTVLASIPPVQYVAQMQWQMACTGRQWCDFISYDPRLPEKMQIFIQRVPRDDAMIENLEKEVNLFLKEIGDKIALLDAAFNVEGEDNGI